MRLALSLLLLSMVGAAVEAQEKELRKRPNILMAFADDWGRYAGAYGQLHPGGPNDIVQTPNFDRIAREGILFANAFVNAPSCTPCRSSLLSGQYFFRTGRGAILQGAIWDLEIPSYPLILKKNGYHIGHTYKVWSPGTPADAPHGAKPHSYVSAGRRFNSFSQNVSGAEDIEAAKQRLLTEARGNFSSFLDARPEDQPFCYWFGPTNCHRKWIQGSGKALWGLDPDTLTGKLPPFLPDVPVVREDFADYLGEVQAFDAGLGVLLDELERRGELDNTLIVVSGDHGAPGFPRGKCNLYDFGVGVPLAMRWGDRLRGSQEERTGSDERLGVWRGRVVEDFVNLMDLAPTFVEAGGVTPPEVMTGRSLLPVMLSGKSGVVDPTRDHVVVGRERHVAAAREGNLPYPQRALRTRNYLLIRNFQPERWPMGTGPGYGEPDGPMPSYEELREQTFVAFGDLDASPTKAWILTNHDDPGMEPFVDFAVGRRPEFELYDLKSDPHQVKNVADDPGYAQIRRQLEQRLMHILEETKDPRVIDGGQTFDNPPFAGEPN